jgi:predicted RNA-binding protein with TRAM domain
MAAHDTAHASSLAVGDEVEVDVTTIAHGGHCIARHEGQVLFVRHALPGERVLARVTETGAGERFVRADAVAMLSASPDRVTPPCPWSGPGRCGGCDLQHVSLPRQRRLKADVVREQFSRLARLDVDVTVEPVPGDDAGLDWRTRVEFAVGADGRAGLRRHRSHEIVAVDHCRIAAPGVDRLRVTGRTWPGTDAVDAVAPSVGDAVAVVVPGGEAPLVRERVVVGAGGEREFTLSARGFWQVHPGAAQTFVDAVLEAAAPRGSLGTDANSAKVMNALHEKILLSFPGAIVGQYDEKTFAVYDYSVDSFMSFETLCEQFVASYNQFKVSPYDDLTSICYCKLGAVIYPYTPLINMVDEGLSALGESKDVSVHTGVRSVYYPRAILSENNKRVIYLATIENFEASLRRGQHLRRAAFRPQGFRPLVRRLERLRGRRPHGLPERDEEL